MCNYKHPHMSKLNRIIWNKIDMLIFEIDIHKINEIDENNNKGKLLITI